MIFVDFFKRIHELRVWFVALVLVSWNAPPYRSVRSFEVCKKIAEVNEKEINELSRDFLPLKYFKVKVRDRCGITSWKRFLKFSFLFRSRLSVLEKKYKERKMKSFISPLLLPQANANQFDWQKGKCLERKQESMLAELVPGWKFILFSFYLFYSLYKRYLVTWVKTSFLSYSSPLYYKFFLHLSSDVEFY